MSSKCLHFLGLFCWLTKHILSCLQNMCACFYMHFRDLFFCSCVQYYIACCSAANLCTVTYSCAGLWLALHPRACMSLVWPLAHLWTHYLWQHSSMGALPQVSLSHATPYLSPRLRLRTSSAVPRAPFDPSLVNETETLWRMSLANPTTSLCIDDLCLSAGAG